MPPQTPESMRTGSDTPFVTPRKATPVPVRLGRMVGPSVQLEEHIFPVDVHLRLFDEPKKGGEQRIRPPEFKVANGRIFTVQPSHDKNFPGSFSMENVTYHDQNVNNEELNKCIIGDPSSSADGEEMFESSINIMYGRSGSGKSYTAGTSPAPQGKVRDPGLVDAQIAQMVYSGGSDEVEVKILLLRDKVMSAVVPISSTRHGSAPSTSLRRVILNNSTNVGSGDMPLSPSPQPRYSESNTPPHIATPIQPSPKVRGRKVNVKLEAVIQNTVAAFRFKGKSATDITAAIIKLLDDHREVGETRLNAKSSREQMALVLECRGHRHIYIDMCGRETGGQDKWINLQAGELSHILSEGMQPVDNFGHWFQALMATMFPTTRFRLICTMPRNPKSTAYYRDTLGLASKVGGGMLKMVVNSTAPAVPALPSRTLSAPARLESRRTVIRDENHNPFLGTTAHVCACGNAGNQMPVTVTEQPRETGLRSGVAQLQHGVGQPGLGNMASPHTTVLRGREPGDRVINTQIKLDTQREGSRLATVTNCDLATDFKAVAGAVDGPEGRDTVLFVDDKEPMGHDNSDWRVSLHALTGLDLYAVWLHYCPNFQWNLNPHWGWAVFMPVLAWIVYQGCDIVSSLLTDRIDLGQVNVPANKTAQDETGHQHSSPVGSYPMGPNSESATNSTITQASATFIGSSAVTVMDEERMQAVVQDAVHSAIHSASAPLVIDTAYIYAVINEAIELAHASAPATVNEAYLDSVVKSAIHSVTASAASAMEDSGIQSIIDSAVHSAIHSVFNSMAPVTNLEAQCTTNALDNQHNSTPTSKLGRKIHTGSAETKGKRKARMSTKPLSKCKKTTARRVKPKAKGPTEKSVPQPNDNTVSEPAKGMTDSANDSTDDHSTSTTKKVDATRPAPSSPLKGDAAAWGLIGGGVVGALVSVFV